jgi:radical SAM protein with 4Fe4S-binding SPASM domain
MMRYPEAVGIETINTCNARCPFCPLFQGVAVMDRMTRPATVMDQSLFIACANEISRWESKPATIYLNMNGEPLSDPLFRRRLSVLRELRLGQIVDLQTNGQYLGEEMANAILEAGVRRITLGFDGATPDIYAKHRVRCDFDRVLANAKRFAVMRDARNYATRIAVQFVRTRMNEHQVLDAYAIFNSFLRPDFDVFQDTLAKDWGDTQSRDDIFYFPKKVSDRPRGCGVFENQMIVLADGVISACCWDYNLTVSEGGFGNARDGLLAVWNGPKRVELAQRMRSPRLDDKPDKCRSCLYLFGGEQIRPDLAKMLGDLSPAGFTYHFARSSGRA